MLWGQLAHKRTTKRRERWLGRFCWSLRRGLVLFTAIAVQTHGFEMRERQIFWKLVKNLLVETYSGKGCIIIHLEVFPFWVEGRRKKISKNSVSAVIQTLPTDSLPWVARPLWDIRIHSSIHLSVISSVAFRSFVHSFVLSFFRDLFPSSIRSFFHSFVCLFCPFVLNSATHSKICFSLNCLFTLITWSVNLSTIIFLYSLKEWQAWLLGLLGWEIHSRYLPHGWFSSLLRRH